MTKQTWSSPALVDYGTAAKITQQRTIDFGKNFGSGDSIVLNIAGVTTTVNTPNGGSITTTVNGTCKSCP
jgi:hypothetical protein